MFITGQAHARAARSCTGMGATVALPFLDAMVPARTRAGAARRPPADRRGSSCIEMVHGAAGSTAFGVKKNLWSPAGDRPRLRSDADAASAPLEPFRDYLTIVSNTDVRNAEAFTPPEIGGDHFRSSAVFLTQSHPKQTQGSDVYAGTSLDQIYAQQFGQDTPIPSMQLCIENVDQAGGCAYGYSCVYTDTISWASPTEPLPMIRDPRVGVRQLFGVGATPEERARAARKTTSSILDWITASGRASCSRELGAGRSRAARPTTSTTCARSSGASRRSRRTTRSGEPRELPGRAGRRARLVRRARQADVRPAGAGVRRPTSRACSRSRSAATRRAASIPESGVDTGVPPASHHGEREERDPRVREDQHVPRQPAAVLPREAEEHAGRRRQPARQHADHLRLADGQLERAQPQALPAVPRRPRRRRS